MAKILAPYSLCPLIEHRNFLGVSDDAQNDCVVVTLSRNMVIRFRLSDRKQLSSWNTTNKLTSPVVYDFFTNKFIGVYNWELVSFWEDSLDQFNKSKKYKFTYLIHSIVSSREVPPHIVYMNGSITPLNVDRDSRKQLNEDYIKTSENIEDAKIVSIVGQYYVSMCTITKNTNEKTLYLVPVSDGKEKITIKLCQQDTNKVFVCQTIIESEVSSNLITLWSNGDLNSLELLPEENELPGRLVGNINFINLSENAALFPISKDQVAIHGTRSNNEGGVVAVYSVKFGVMEVSENLKVCNNVGKSLIRPRELIIPSGANLLVIPYKLHTARLAGLIGSQVQPLEGSFDDLCKQGVAESRICTSLLPHHIESKNSEGVLKILESCSDIPDEALLRSLCYALNAKKDGHSEAIIQSVLRKQLIGDTTSLRLIRTYISLTSALFLLKSLREEISLNPGNSIPIDWACILLDAHYQQYLLSKEPDVIHIIKNVMETISEQLDYMTELKMLSWEIKDYLTGKTQVKQPSLSSRNYIIETIQLY